MKSLFTYVILAILPSLSISQTWLNYFSTNEVNNARISNNILWASTPGGIIKYDLITQTKEYFNRENGKLPFNYSDHIACDLSGNVFFCSFSIFQFNEITYNDLKPYYTPFNQITDSDINSKGEIWFTELMSGILIYDGVKWKYFNSGNSGLPNAYFHCIKHDQNGNTWVGTSNGLYKYDGINWTKYDKSNSGLPSNIILDVAVEKNNTIWVSATDWTNENTKLIKYDGLNWVSYSRSDYGNIDGTIDHVEVDSLGIIWISGSFSGISKYDGVKWTLFSDYYTSYINDFTPDKNGNMWLSTKHGLYKVRDTQAELVDLPGGSLPSNPVESISFDPFGKTWITTRSENGYFENNQFHEINELKYSGSLNGYYRCSTIDSLGNIWLGYLGGVLMNDGDNIIKYIIPEGNVICLTTDKLGNVWVGYSGGVSKFSGAILSKYNQSNTGISFGWVNDILCTDGNEIWIASDREGIIKYSNNQWTNITTANSNLPSNTVYSLAFDKNKNLIVGTDSGLRIYKNGMFALMPDGGVLNSNKIKDIAIDSTGSIFVVMDGYGLIKFSHSNMYQFQTYNSGLQYFTLNKIEVDCNNNIWIATYKGLSIFNETGIVLQPPSKPQLLYPKPNLKNISNEITLKWNSFNDAVNYSLQVATDSLFKNITYMDSMIVGITKNISTISGHNKYYWRVRAKTPNKYSEWSYIWNFTTDGTSTILNESALPSQYSLSQNYPNPFNPVTSIKYAIPQRSFITIRVYDLLGKEILSLVNEEKEAGYYQVEFNGSRLTSGIYFYSMHVGDYLQTKKLIFLK